MSGPRSFTLRVQEGPNGGYDIDFQVDGIPDASIPYLLAQAHAMAISNVYGIDGKISHVVSGVRPRRDP